MHSCSEIVIVILIIICIHLEVNAIRRHNECPPSSSSVRKQQQECSGPFHLRPSRSQQDGSCDAATSTNMTACLLVCQRLSCCRAFGLDDITGTCVTSNVSTEALHFVIESPVFERRGCVDGPPTVPDVPPAVPDVPLPGPGVPSTMPDVPSTEPDVQTTVPTIRSTYAPVTVPLDATVYITGVGTGDDFTFEDNYRAGAAQDITKIEVYADGNKGISSIGLSFGSGATVIKPPLDPGITPTVYPVCILNPGEWIKQVYVYYNKDNDIVEGFDVILNTDDYCRFRDTSTHEVKLDQKGKLLFIEGKRDGNVISSLGFAFNTDENFKVKG